MNKLDLAGYPARRETGGIIDDPHHHPQGEIRREAAMGLARALVEGVGETDPERVARLAVEMADAVLRHLQQASK